MFDPAIFAAAYALFHAHHGIADYWGQTDWQARFKGQGRWYGNVALWSHIVVYTSIVACALVTLAAMGVHTTLLQTFAVFWSIALPHAWMDTRKPITWFCEKTKGWTPDGKVHITYTDQDLIALQKATVMNCAAQIPYCKFDETTEDGHFNVIYATDVKKFYVYRPRFASEHEANDMAGWLPFEPIRTAARDLTPAEIAIRLHVTIAMDQHFHKACLAMTALFIAWR